MLTSSYSTRLAYLSLVGINNGKHYLFRKTGVECSDVCDENRVSDENPGWERRETEETPNVVLFETPNGRRLDTQLYQVLNNGL